ncbi:MAG: penicillin acylase family protein, partial [Candidatus Marinimicrobia bacterium]|nr:penicillin acylase family protein [Candidatus Neomarinimicrobiota bacterium]
LLPDVDKQSSTAFPASPAKISESDVTKDLLAKMGKLEKWGLQSFEGSNNWAVGGAKTKSGAPIFCNDMHLGLNAPGLWYQIHQHVEGKVNVTGVLLPGQPFIIAGHNEDIAWGMTNVMVDDMDFYEERINESGDKYEYLGEWHDLENVVENIGLKGGGDTTITNYYTQRGPIISSLKGIDDRWISMTWTGFGFSDELRSVYLLNRASNWDEFRDAVSTFRSVSQNVNYADRFGNIGLHNCAGIPIRPDGMNGIDIYPGWTDEFNWKGIVPFEEQLYSFNPAENYVSSANNKTAVNDYPYPVSTWFALHYRIDRIRELLDSNDNITVEKMKTIQTDIESIFVREVKPLIISNLIERNDLSDLEKNMLNKLLAWDNQVRKESAEAAVFELFYVNFLKNMMEDELGAELYVEYTKSSYLARYFMNNLVINEDSYYVDDITTEAVENLSDIMLKSYRQALAELKEKSSSNPDDWQWGDIHKLILKHPLGSVKILDRLFHFNTEPIPAQGSFHTVAPCAYKLSDPFDVNHGASQRHIYTPDNWDNSFTVIPSGNSGIPASDHYCDQTKLYMDFKYHHDYFSLEKIKSAAKYEQKL